MQVNGGGDFLLLLKRLLTLGHAPVVGVTRYARVLAAKRSLFVSQIKADFERFHASKDSNYRLDNQATILFFARKSEPDLCESARKYRDCTGEGVQNCVDFLIR